MDYTDTNKLIAEFMRYKSYKFRGYTMFVYEENNHRADIDLHYHKQWNWLMTVVEKIADKKDWSIHATLEWLSESQDRDGLYELRDIYNAVVEFINHSK